MDLKGIMAISGYPGLFKMVSQAKGSIIVESLIDGKRMPAFNSYKISSLEDIAIFTEDKEVPLTEVFKKMLVTYENKPSLDSKASNNELVKAFSAFLPDYDKDKVYVSDIKKVFSWYNMLLAKDLLKDAPETEKKEGEENTEDTTAKPAKAKKAATKTATPKDSNSLKTKAAKPSKTQSKPAVVKKSSSSSSGK